MKCYACGRAYREHEGTLNLHNDIIGDYNVYSARYYKCEGCGTLLFPKDTVKKIEIVETEKQNNLIRQLPVDEFIMATEASDLLGISKQAFHKHRRIKKGFIYSVDLGGKKLYSRKSVLLFKTSGDGRFDLSSNSSDDVKYVTVYTNIASKRDIYKSGPVEVQRNLYPDKTKEIAAENRNYISN